jgi:hypothetical protein
VRCRNDVTDLMFDRWQDHGFYEFGRDEYFLLPSAPWYKELQGGNLSFIVIRQAVLPSRLNTGG